MMKKKIWKFQSNDRLSSKLHNGSSPPTPIEFHTSVVLTNEEKQQFEGFTLTRAITSQRREESLRSERDRETSKMMRSVQFQEMERKVKERQELRLSAGSTSKTILRMQQELRKAERELEEKELELVEVNSELNLTEQSVNLKKRQSEDIANNENMLKFKEDQLNNLKAIHLQIVQGMKKQIKKQKQLREINQAQFINKKKNLDELRIRLGQKQNMIRYIEELNKEKMRLQKFLQEFKETEARKFAMRSGAVRDYVEKIIKANRTKLEMQCEQKIKIVRDASVLAKNTKELKIILENKGITPKNYYTFNQLKYVPEFNFRNNKQAQYIIDVLDREIHPKMIDIVDQNEQPQELIDLRNKLTEMEDFKALSEVQLKQKELVIQELEKQKKQLQSSINEAKVKAENK